MNDPVGIRFADLTYDEVRLAKAGALAVVPTGSTEQRGLHLPIGFDTWFSDTVATSAAQEATRKYGLRGAVEAFNRSRRTFPGVPARAAVSRDTTDQRTADSTSCQFEAWVV